MTAADAQTPKPITKTRAREVAWDMVYNAVAAADLRVLWSEGVSESDRNLILDVIGTIRADMYGRTTAGQNLKREARRRTAAALKVIGR
jgi:hypothetical protein